MCESSTIIEEKDVLCKKADKIQCHCGACVVLAEPGTARYMRSQTFAKKGGGYYKTGYFYCLACQVAQKIDDGTASPIAYQFGGSDEDPEIMLSYPDRDHLVSLDPS